MARKYTKAEILAVLPELIPDRAERERWYAIFPEARGYVASIRNRALTEVYQAIESLKE